MFIRIRTANVLNIFQANMKPLYNDFASTNMVFDLGEEKMLRVGSNESRNLFELRDISWYQFWLERCFIIRKTKDCIRLTGFLRVMRHFGLPGVYCKVSGRFIQVWQSHWILNPDPGFGPFFTVPEIPELDWRFLSMEIPRIQKFSKVISSCWCSSGICALRGSKKVAQKFCQ